jgi:hypothetical protein
MAWNEPYVKTETVKITAPTAIVTTPTKYHPGLGDLVVYLNGSYMIKGKEYTELTPYSIQFIEDLEQGDTVVFHYQKLW